MWLITCVLVMTMDPSNMAASSSNDLSCSICRFIPGLNSAQQDLCCDVPKAISLLDLTERSIQTECKWQLRKELWNCSNIGRPIFREPGLRGEDFHKRILYA